MAMTSWKWNFSVSLTICQVLRLTTFICWQYPICCNFQRIGQSMNPYKKKKNITLPLLSYPRKLIPNFRASFPCPSAFPNLLAISWLRNFQLTKQSSSLLSNLFLLGCIIWRNIAMHKMIPVALSDVFFPFHSIILICVVSVQIVFFDRGSQKVSKAAIAILVAVWFFAGACFFKALPTHSWLWLVSIFNSIQVFMTFIKYSPQAFLNFTRKSTVGFSIGNIVLDFSGGVATLAQMSVQSVDQGSWVNFLGNIGKPLLALVSIAFDLIFFYQHFVLYHIKASRVSFQRDPESTDSEPLIKDSDHLQGIATTS